MQFTDLLRPDMFFLQIGANDGVRRDPIRKYILELHWRGVLVEPIPGVFASLVSNYSGVAGLQFENAAVCNTNGKVKFFIHPKHSDCSGLKVRTRKQKRTTMVESEVSAITFESLLVKYGIQQLDLLQLDAEGFDFEIIKTVPFPQMRPGILRYEHKHIDNAACMRYLADWGYSFMHEKNDTVAFLHPRASTL